MAAAEKRLSQLLATGSSVARAGAYIRRRKRESGASSHPRQVGEGMMLEGRGVEGERGSGCAQVERGREESARAREVEEDERTLTSYYLLIADSFSLVAY